MISYFFAPFRWLFGQKEQVHRRFNISASVRGDVESYALKVMERDREVTVSGIKSEMHGTYPVDDYEPGEFGSKVGQVLIDLAKQNKWYLERNRHMSFKPGYTEMPAEETEQEIAPQTIVYTENVFPQTVTNEITLPNVLQEFGGCLR